MPHTPPEAPAPPSRACALLLNLPKTEGFAANVVVRPVDSPTYIATHDTEPPKGQVIQNETENILLRQFKALADAKKEKQKRAASETDEPRPKSARTANGKAKAT